MDCPQCVDEYETGAHLEGWSAAAAAAAAGWTAPAAAKQYCLAQVLVAKAKKYASNAAFTIHNAKLKPFTPGSIPWFKMAGYGGFGYDGYW